MSEEKASRYCSVLMPACTAMHVRPMKQYSCSRSGAGRGHVTEVWSGGRSRAYMQFSPPPWTQKSREPVGRSRPHLPFETLKSREQVRQSTPHLPFETLKSREQVGRSRPHLPFETLKSREQ
eukprot:365829-Chlamydomonas_euryale.AAC.9